MRKKKILFHSNYAAAKTGFGGFMREILSYLYKTGKYDLHLFAAGMPWEHPDFERFPWKTYGTLPNNPREMEMIHRDPNLARAANYGDMLIDKAIQTVKPDVYVGVEDPWGIEYCKNKQWWGKIPCVVHTTLDSRPIYAGAWALAKTTPYFFSWADFATKEMNKGGAANVKTLRGCVNSDAFKRLDDSKRKELRARARIPEDAYCFGMLSRNQLRKSFPNIIHAYKAFKDRNPSIKTRLLFFTHFSEGWDIPALCNEIGVDKNEVLATYKCRATGRYYVLPFSGQEINNPETGHPKSMVTVNFQEGLTEEQVNEWYNLLDVYVHAFTSGGQERSIQEAKLAELITLVTNYSCGEDSCCDEAASLPLDYSEYREPGSQFIKATTNPYSIVKQLERVYKMDAARRREMGKKGRQWVLDNFSIEVIGKKFEELFDSLPFTDYDFNFKSVAEVNPTAVVEPLSDNRQWVKALYKNILCREVQEDDEGLHYWLAQLQNNAPRPQIEDYFRKVANDEMAKNGPPDIDKFLGNEPAEDRVLISMPESLGDCLMLTALLKDAREQYPNKKIYVATKPQFADVFRPIVGQYIDAVLAWRPEFDNSYLLEGACGHKKYFQVMLNPHFPTQRMINYLHNADDKSAIDLRYEPKILSS